jgi:hypothetical protein
MSKNCGKWDYRCLLRIKAPSRAELTSTLSIDRLHSEQRQNGDTSEKQERALVAIGGEVANGPEGGAP